MDFTAIGVKVPSGSGPKSSVSLRRITPRNVVPDTTVPTPCQETKVNICTLAFFSIKSENAQFQTPTIAFSYPERSFSLHSSKFKALNNNVFIFYSAVKSSESPHSHLHAGLFRVGVFYVTFLCETLVVFVSVIAWRRSKQHRLCSPQGLTWKNKSMFKKWISVCVTSHRYGVCVIYLELGGLVVVEVGPGRQEVEEHLQQVHVLPCHVWDLKDRTHPAEKEGGSRSKTCQLKIII